jgi:hypothetical protein
MQQSISCDFEKLSESSPKTLRVMGNVSTCSIAAAFYQGLIDCVNPSRTAPLSAYLRAEGPKRIPAFVFEQLFVHRLKTTFEVSNDWYICDANHERSTSICFKLLPSARDWSALDNAFARSLKLRGIPVWRAWFAGTQLWLSEVGNGLTPLSAREFLDNNPGSMDIGHGRVRSMLTTGKLPENAVHMLTEAGATANDELIRSRIFINCFLELTGGRPFDVDAICRRGDQIFATEFKRKYPSRDNLYGVDQHLIKLPRLLGPIPLYHFVLEDLRGKGAKGRDPTTAMLSAHDEGPDFRWHALRLNPGFEKMYTGELVTRGSDSGQKGGTRKQVGIPVNAFTRLPSPEAIDLAML